jgi:GntR family transcriptional repressor for pyruvate dehydrogenase complex
MLPLRRQSLVGGVCAEISRRWITPQPVPDGAEDRWLPPERDLSRKLDVSRTVLREALQRLESQGLVEIRHGIGVRVATNLHKPVVVSLGLLLPDEAPRLRAAMEARLLTEPLAARLAAQRGSPKAGAELGRIHERLLGARVAEEAIRHDMDFHRQLARLAGNEPLLLLLEAVADVLRERRKLTHFKYGLDNAHEHHQRILDAVLARDGAAAEAAMREHLAFTARDLESQLDEEARRARST